MSPEEQARISEIDAAISDPTNQQSIMTVLGIVNNLYDPAGLNMIGQIHSVENESGRTFFILLEDTTTTAGKVYQTKIHPDGTVEPTVLFDKSI